MNERLRREELAKRLADRFEDFRSCLNACIFELGDEFGDRNKFAERLLLLPLDLFVMHVRHDLTEKFEEWEDEDEDEEEVSGNDN